jgi:ribosomal protein S18 acetylase RimI-like enzyme
MLDIEEATYRDARRVCRLDEAVVGNFSKHGLLLEAIQSSRCLIARTGDDLAGFAVFEQSFFGQCFISLVAVHPDHWRRGVATALIRRIEQICPTEKLFTSTNRSNTAMQALCEKLGFVESGYIENLDEGDPEIVYFKSVGERR